MNKKVMFISKIEKAHPRLSKLIIPNRLENGPNRHFRRGRFPDSLDGFIDSSVNCRVVFEKELIQDRINERV